jgi:hypothetical protein
MLRNLQLQQILGMASRRMLSDGFGSSGWRGFVLAWLVLSACWSASAQEWHAYQLTNSPAPSQMRLCGSVADTLGHIHHYFVSTFGPHGDDGPLYYMRTDFFGRVLTDTVAVNPGLQWPYTSFMSVVGDGGRCWCVWAGLNPLDSTRSAFFLCCRDAQGQEVQPMTQIGTYSFNYGPSYLVCTFRPADSTICMISAPTGYLTYSVFSLQGVPHLWCQPIDGLVGFGEYPSIATSPADGHVWAAMRSDRINGVGVLAVRFGDDTSQTVIHPLADSLLGWGGGHLGIDSLGNCDLNIGNETSFGCARLNSTFQEVLNWYSPAGYLSAGKTDLAGNCLWVGGADPGLWWAYRQADNVWTHPPALIDQNIDAHDITVVSAERDRFAFTFEGGPSSDVYEDLWLYTYGDFPDAVPEPRHAHPHISTLSSYPNPFNSTTRISFTLPQREHVNVKVFDVTGRRIATLADQAFESGAHDVEFRADNIATGVYFVRVDTQESSTVTKVMLLR